MKEVWLQESEGNANTAGFAPATADPVEEDAGNGKSR